MANATNVPGRTRVAIVGDDDVINEIVNYDHTRVLVRDCKKMVDLGTHDEVRVGWKHIQGGLYPPDGEKGGAS